MKREQEIKTRRYEIIQELKELKKELLRLREEEQQIYGEKKIERNENNTKYIKKHKKFNRN